ncbi:MAG: tRNA (guanosine(46)-N7)-methyltransferase TrmB [Magnetococcales bacterium]|nr:tRNA (guanosine(46)-N7)-methyltransferase TrmB [Magnetococcales bacterium]
MIHDDPLQTAPHTPTDSPTGDALPWKPKVHGRKRGFLTPREKLWLDETLPELLPPVAPTRRELLQALEADPDSARLVLEVGFGNGQFLTRQAAANPQDRFIGIEVFQEGMAALIRRLQREGITNTRIIPDDARLVLQERIPPESLDWVVINFPDPWPKKRHHKRRIVQPEMLDLLARRLRSRGLLTLATDWEEYALWMADTLENHGAFENLAAPDRFAPQPEFWHETRFELKGVHAGRRIHHLVWRRKD